MGMLMNTSDPMRIAMRTASLGAVDAAMLGGNRTRLQYADKQKPRIDNAWKKWIGGEFGV
ncbi:MAG: hypothetical protein IPP83_00420 [Flavobacteriales bacterium]|nr:hypothetical protein [Flavobacteriales bacterium]